MSSKIYGNITERVADGLDDVIVGKLSATTDTDGFLYIPSVAGVPTGTPTTRAGYTAFCFDSTNHNLYRWNGSAWKYVAVNT